MEQLILLLCLLSAVSPSVRAEKNSSSVLQDARDSLDSVEEYIEERKAKLAMKTNSFDVFGRPQDVQKAKKEEKEEKEVVAVVASRRTPLQKVLDALPLTLIDPLGDRVMLKGVPPMKVGQILELALGGETVLLKFEGARSEGAYFRDVKTQKLGLCSMNKIAKGIQRGGRTKGSEKIQRLDLNQSQSMKLELNMANQPN